MNVVFFLIIFLYSFKMFFISYVLYCLSLGNIFVYSEVCNPIGCFNIISKIFQHDIHKNSCVKITNVENCVHHCYSETSYIDSKIFKGLQEVKQEICENDRGNKLSNKCVDKHKYLLLFCLHESFQLNAVNRKTNQKLLMCKRVSEAENCDVGTLVSCSHHASYIADVLLEKIFKPLHTEFCTFDDKEIFGLNVTYPVLSNDYKKLAVCFDLNNHLFDSCISNSEQSSNSVVYHFSYKMCKVVESFLDCIHGIIQERCHSERNLFKSLSQSMFEYVLPKCFPFSESSKIAKLKNFQNSQNSTGLIMANQHVVNEENGTGSLLIHFFNIVYIGCAVFHLQFWNFNFNI